MKNRLIHRSEQTKQTNMTTQHGILSWFVEQKKKRIWMEKTREI